MAQSSTFIERLQDRIAEIPPDSILSQTIYADDRVKVTLFGFAPGQEMTEHTAAHPAVLTFVSGEGSLRLGSEEFKVSPGCWLHMPADTPHSLRAETELTFVLHLLK